LVTATRAASWPTTVAANAVLLRDPLKPARPDVHHEITLPRISLIATVVLLNVALMWAIPEGITFMPRALPRLTGAADA
jgi:hypothetical protein